MQFRMKSVLTSCLIATAFFGGVTVLAQESTRTELRRTDLSGAPGMEVVMSISELKPGDELEVERGDLKLVVKVLDFPKARLGAPLVPQFMENLTPEENYHRAAEARKMKEWTTPHQAATKPDKKQLRLIRELMERNQ